MRLASIVGSGALFFLLLGGMLLGYFRIPTQLGVSQYSDQITSGLIVGGGILLSLVWCVFPAIITSYSVSRNRGSDTSELIATTPYSPSEVVLVRAASDLREVWSLLLNSVLLCIFAAVPAVYWIVFLSAGFSRNHGLILLVISIFAIAASAVERLQELALSIIVGLAAGVATKSTLIAQLVGIAAGLSIRILQLLFTVALLQYAPFSRTLPLSMPVFPVIGSSTVMMIDARLTTIILICWLYIFREALIRILFRYIMHKVTDQ